jgi:hypothetical protein
MPSEAERWNNYRAQMMLAGSNPRKNQVNAWSMMNDPNVSEEQRRSLQYMLPGGELAAGVDANSAKNAVRLLNAEMLGQGGQGELRDKMMQQQTREKAADMAEKEAAKLMGWGKPNITPQEADRIRRRVEARYPGYGDVVDGLSVDEGQPQPAGTPNGGVPSPWPAAPALPPQTGPGGLAVPPGSTPYRTGA